MITFDAAAGGRIEVDGLANPGWMRLTVVDPDARVSVVIMEPTTALALAAVLNVLGTRTGQ